MYPALLSMLPLGMLNEVGIKESNKYTDSSSHLLAICFSLLPFEAQQHLFLQMIIFRLAVL